MTPLVAEGVLPASDRRDPSISADGRFLAYTVCKDPGFIAGYQEPSGVGHSRSSVYVFDRKSGRSELVNVADGGGEATGCSFNPSISADGYAVAFLSDASSLVSGTAATPGVYLHCLLCGRNERLDIGSNGLPSGVAGYLWVNGATSQPAVSRDASICALVSAAGDLVDADENGKAGCV